MPGLRKLLSIDGGGVRGLAAIVVLEQLMEVANAERSNKGLSPQEPWQMFDMIGGTSTGGLIAIMLGRLRMSLDECKTAYTELSGMAFTKRNILERVSGKPSLGAKFKSKSLDNAILGILEAKKDFLGASSSDALMKDEQKDCYVFVVSHLENISGTLAILRSYRNLTHPVKQFHTMKLWQACRATSAATTFFDPVDVNGSRYSDGALIYNNPVQLVHNEAGEMFPGEPTLIISLGTGIAAYKEFSPNVLNIGVQLAEIATQTDRDADAFFRQDGGKMHHLQRYFRFDIPGIGDISLDEADQLDMIKHASEKYMEIGETTVKMGMCSQQLSSESVTFGLRDDILQSLRSYAMNPRQDSVLHLGLAKSYSWVWNERKHNLVEWLKGGGDLFRIKGKTGSGKSTLMKYLLTHQNTQKYLNMYQGNSKVCAYFFHELSELATQQESSITGLLHSILSQLLELFPPFADTILPLYQKYKSLHGDNVAWPVNLLKGALNQMSHETSVTGNLCLFIDGFDECRGNRHEHLEFLIEWTRLMAKTSLKVKICLASCDLPELASLNANLVLHQWTKPGITDFVKKELTGAMQHTISMDLKDHGIVISKLVQKVVNKADGVFVWAKLVVEDLVLGLKAGEDEAALEHRLSNLPQHLKDLYAHMISKIPDANLHIAFKYFQLLLRAPGDTCTMNFLQFLMASQIPEKAIDSSQPFPERYFLPHNSEPAILEKLGVMREHLKEICGNLIQIQPRRHASYRWQATRRENVTFIHLSFKDYIKDDDVKIDLEKRMSPRNVHPADKLLMASCLRLLKTQRCYVPYWVKRRKEVYQPTEETHPSQKLVSISHEVDRSPWPPPNESYQSDKNSVTNSVTESSANDNENIDDDDDEFLEELNLRTPDNTITMFFNYAHNLESESILGEAQTSYIDNLDATLRDMDARWASSFFDHRTRNYIPGIDVLCLAVCWKLHLYVEGKLNERKLRSHNIRAHKPPLLYYAMNPPGWAHEPVDMDMLSILLAAGEHPGETLYNEEEETIETMWDHIVRHYLRIGSAYPLDGWQDVLRLMLKYEANPVQLILQRDGGSASIMHLLIDQYENQYEKATQNEKDNTLYFFIFLLSSKKYADGLCSLQNSGGLNCYDYAESISSDIIKKSYTQHFSATPKLLQAPGDIDDSSSATPESRPRRRKLINKDSATLPKRHKKS